MHRIKIVMIRFWRNAFVRIGLAGSMIYSMFTVCPCCGKPSCPAGWGIAALVGALSAVGAVLFVESKMFLKKALSMLSKFIKTILRNKPGPKKIL